MGRFATVFAADRISGHRRHIFRYDPRVDASFRNIAVVLGSSDLCELDPVGATDTGNFLVLLSCALDLGAPDWKLLLGVNRIHPV